MQGARTRSWRAVALASVLTGAALVQGGAARAAPPAGDYKVGFITENTGALAFAGQSYWHGAELATEEVNAADYVGKGAKIVLSDKESGSDPARAIQAMHQFIADRTVLATSCCILSPVVGSVKPVVLNAKLPLVIFGATAPGLPQPPLVTSMTILPGPKDVATARAVVEAMKPKTIAYFVAADNDAFKARMAAAQQAAEAAGAKTAGVISVLSADTDFTAPATQAMALKPDAIMVYTTQGAAVGVITALRARGYAGPIVGNDVLSPQSVFKKMGQAVVGVPFPISFSATASDVPEAKQFAAAYQQKFSAPPDIYSAQGYEVVWFLAQALKSLSAAPTRESLAGAIGQIKSIDHNVYGGETMHNGQAETAGTLIVAWTAEGKLATWTPPK